MNRIEIILTTSFGIEAVCKRELLGLGYKEENIKLDNGKVTLKGEVSDIARLNLFIRSADRVLLKFGEFKATTFDELFEKTKALPWGDLIPVNGAFPVDGSSVDSKLFSISDSQAIVKKAIVDKLSQKYGVLWFEETGEVYNVKVSLLKDIVTLTVDTSGVGLHKRGYRVETVKAPLQETLAAALVLLSFWDNKRFLLDPFTGSGTIPIEACMIGRNIAPGMNRNFVSEDWGFVDKKHWNRVREETWDVMDEKTGISIVGLDINPRFVENAKRNAESFFLEDDILFLTRDFKDFELRDRVDDYGVIIGNPPYGERLTKDVKKLYTELGEFTAPLKNFSNYFLTSFKDFEKYYGKKADRKRKLYNGRIEVDYYQYYGPKPKEDR